jgi:RimJ/RimL family protein N-acetyltransferase
MRILLETDRLILREFVTDDLASLIELNSDPEVMQYLTGGAALPADFIRQEVLPRFLSFHLESASFGYWAVVERQTNDFIGWFPFRLTDILEDGVELGFRFRRNSWGRGCATEGVRALIAKGFGELGVRQMFARAMASNAASIRVLTKAGLRLERTYQEPEFPSGQQSAVLYAISNPRLGVSDQTPNSP